MQANAGRQRLCDCLRMRNVECSRVPCVWFRTSVCLSPVGASLLLLPSSALLLAPPPCLFLSHASSSIILGKACTPLCPASDRFLNQRASSSGRAAMGSTVVCVRAQSWGSRWRRWRTLASLAMVEELASSLVVLVAEIRWPPFPYPFGVGPAEESGSGAYRC